MKTLANFVINAGVILASVGTMVGMSGALFVIPSINEGEPSMIWSLTGIACAAVWGWLMFLGMDDGEDRPQLNYVGCAFSLIVQMLNCLVLSVLQGTILLLWIVMMVFGKVSALDMPWLLISNVGMLLIILNGCRMIFLTSK